MMRLLLTLLFSVSILITAFADDNKAKSESNSNATVWVTGKVTDSNTGETLVGVKVNLEGADVTVYTDFEGNFDFEDIKPGKYSIKASFISYKEHKVENKNIDLFTENFNVELEPLQ